MRNSKPHTFFGEPEAHRVLRLINNGSAGALGELQRFAISCGLATMETDAANTVARMRRAAEDVLFTAGSASDASAEQGK